MPFSCTEEAALLANTAENFLPVLQNISERTLQQMAVWGDAFLVISIHSLTKTDFYLQVRGQGPEGKIKQMEIQEAGLDQTIDPTEGYARKKA